MSQRTRRQMLAQMGAASIGMSLTGCLRVVDENPVARPIQNPNPNFPLFLSDSEFEMGDAPTPNMATRFGTAETAHQCIIFAETPGALDTTFTVRRVGHDSFWEGTATLSSSEYAYLLFSEQHDYRVEIDTKSHMGEFTIPEDIINCHDSVTGIVLRIGGGIKRRETIPDEPCADEDETDDENAE